jgi:hypothetical protein
MQDLASVVVSVEKNEGIVINFPRWSIAMSRDTSNVSLLKYHDLPVQELVRRTERERKERKSPQSSQDSTASQQPVLGPQHPPLSPLMPTTRLSMERDSIPINSSTFETFGSSSQAMVLPLANVHVARTMRSTSPPPFTMRPTLKHGTTMTTKLVMGAPSHDASPNFNDAEQESSSSSDNYEGSGGTPSHSEDGSDTESGYGEPSRSKRPVPRKGGPAPHQKNDTGDIDNDEDEDVLAAQLPLDDIPEAVLRDTLAALQRFTLECNQIAQKHGVSPSVPRWVFLNAESLGLNKRCANPFNAYQQTEMVKRGWHKSYTKGQHLTPGTLLLS